MTTEAGRVAGAAVVVNPERTDVADAFLAALGDDADTVRVIRPSRPEDLPDAMADALDDGATALAAIGGDGTQRTAAIAVAGTGHPLVVVPGGTVNLLGQIIGITSVEDSAAALKSGRTRTVDLACAGEDLFVLNASSGFDAEVIHDVGDSEKKLGRLGFLLAGVRRLRRSRPRQVTVTVDDRVVYQGRAMAVLVANFAQRGSGDFDVVRGAEPDDGRIDVAIQRCNDVRSIARAFLALWRHERPRPSDMQTDQGETVDVEWTTKVWCQQDGDATGQTRTLHYTVRPGALTLAIPPIGKAQNS